MTNLLKETWTNLDGKEFRVVDLYEEYCLLKDLDAQPDYVKEILKTNIDEALAKPGKYSHFHFLAFCGKYELKNTVKYIDNLMPILLNKPKDNTQFYS
jgi:hypothetical protein